jgi:tetratricopeptide (TPR) repeat protein
MAERYREGKIVLEQFLATHQRDAVAHYYLGRIHLELQEYDKAIEHCQTAADIQAQNAEHYFCLGIGYGKKAQRASFVSKAFLAPKIKQSFEKTVMLDPHHIEGRVGLANFYLQAPPVMGGDVEKAYEQAMVLLKLNAEEGRQLLDKVLQRKAGDAEDAWQEQGMLSD